MKRLSIGLAFIAAAVCLCCFGIGVWFYFYTADLPSISQLQQFDPSVSSTVRLRHCGGSETLVNVTPYQDFEPYLVHAVLAAEGEPDSRSPFRAVIEDFRNPSPAPYGRYSWQIARLLVCGERSPLGHTVEELRVANTIERRFSSRQIFTIYLNTAYFGEQSFGAESASSLYFHRHTHDLSLAQAATLAALIRNPTGYSPELHPERALQRRNAILDEMAVKGNVATEDADRAKTVQILVNR